MNRYLEIIAVILFKGNKRHGRNPNGANQNGRNPSYPWTVKAIANVTGFSKCSIGDVRKGKYWVKEADIVRDNPEHFISDEIIAKLDAEEKRLMAEERANLIAATRGKPAPKLPEVFRSELTNAIWSGRWSQAVIQSVSGISDNRYREISRRDRSMAHDAPNSPVSDEFAQLLDEERIRSAKEELEQAEKASAERESAKQARTKHEQ
jgi:hypothetical protein